MVEFKAITPVLKLTDLQRATAFSSDLLGFPVAWRSNNDGGGENAILRTGTATFLLSTGMQDFFERNTGTGEVVWSLRAINHGQPESGIRDPNGYGLSRAATARLPLPI